MSLIDQIANEMLLTVDITKSNSVKNIAEKLGYQPILLMNALFKGERDGKFTYVKKKDILRVPEGIDYDNLQITDGLADSRDQIEEFIANENGIETDLSIDELRMFIPNLSEDHVKLILRTSRKLVTYEVADPKDKESVYTFITLKENIDKKFGLKQFDEKKVAKKLAKRGK